jgi:hypothetical protein
LRILGICLAGLVLFAGLVRAKDGDLLDRTKRSTSLAAQKVEAEVRTDVLEAQRLFTTDRGKAIDRLKKALTRLDEDTALSDGRRESLRRMLRDRIRVFEIDTAKVEEKTAARTEKKAAETERHAEEDRQTAEQKIVQRNIDTVHELLRAGRPEDARNIATQLARKYPGNKEVLALFRGMSIREQAGAERGLRQEGDRRRIDHLRSVDKSSMPPSGDIEFDKEYWRKVVSKRKPATGNLTPKEEALLKALGSPIRVNFKESRFQDVIETLSTMLGQPIFVDKESMDIAQISYDTQVSLPLKGTPVAARTILRKVLHDLGLTYVVKDEVIQVVTAEKAKNMLTTRAYPISDLVSGGLFGMYFGPAVQAAEMRRTAKMIMDMVTSTVDPPSWQVNNRDGLGTIAFEPSTMSLIIKNSAEVHSMLGGALFR